MQQFYLTNTLEYCVLYLYSPGSKFVFIFSLCTVYTQVSTMECGLLPISQDSTSVSIYGSWEWFGVFGANSIQK